MNIVRNLTMAEIGKEYTVVKVETDESDLKDFLFTLGCYEGGKITVISVLSDNYVVAIKNARYSIDDILAKSILI